MAIKNRCCPNCSNEKTFSTIEKTIATSSVDYITSDGVIEWTGETDCDDFETIGIICMACGWEHIGKNWMAALHTKN